MIFIIKYNTIININIKTADYGIHTFYQNQRQD